ncbi:MAG: LacI family DNA-binding transcriptional regulator [Verrucomicrobiota bacterium]
MKRRTIGRNDIAKLAGVSGATVSYALSVNNAYRVNKSTRERILQLVDELGYQPFFPGKTLATGKSYHVGLLLPSKQMLASQHLMAIVRGISDKVSRTDYNLVLFYRSDLAKCLSSIETRRIDALFVIGNSFDFNLDKRAKAFPVVVVDGPKDTLGFDNICNVRSDHEKMIKESIDYFISKSCGNVLGILAGPHDVGESTIAIEAFLEQCGRKNSNFFGSILKPGRNFSEQMRSMIKAGRKWDAFLINNECLSNLVLEALEESGQKEGTDFQMVVYSTANQRFSCNSYRNKVKCQRLYVEEEAGIGEKAWDVIENIISGQKHEEQCLIPYRLWERPEKPLPCYWNSEVPAGK